MDCFNCASLTAGRDPRLCDLCAEIVSERLETQVPLGFLLCYETRSPGTSGAFFMSVVRTLWDFCDTWRIFLPDHITRSWRALPDLCGGIVSERLGVQLISLQIILVTYYLEPRHTPGAFL